MINVTCPQCGSQKQYQDEHRGKTTKCKDCGEPIKLPSTVVATGTISCPDCNGKVSVKALACPHCGCPFERNQQRQAAIMQTSGVVKSEGPKSFTGKAVATFVLYWFFWIPGAVANIIFYKEALKERDRVKDDPDGFGPLWAMYYFLFLIPICIALIGGTCWLVVTVLAMMTLQR